MQSDQQWPIEEIVIRPSSSHDVDAVERLFQVHLNWINVWFQDATGTFRTTNITARCIEAFPGSVALHEGQMIGFVNSRMRDPLFVDLVNIYVDDPYRRHGVGTALLRSLESQLRDRGAKTVMGTSSSRWFPGKPSARGLFARAGYELLHLNPETDLFLKRDLDAEGDLLDSRELTTVD